MITSTGLQNLLAVMTMMAETERLIADFYRTCADLWEEDREFWLSIVAEEEKHAANLDRMARIVAARPERFEIGRPFNQAAIRTVTAGIESQLKRLKEDRVTRERLLYMARDTEASVIEKFYGEIVRTSDVEYLTLLKEITQETLDHKRGIEERIQALKKEGKP